MSELLKMTSYELSERMVYDNRIRISEMDVLAAKICHTLACVHTQKGKRVPKLDDFLPMRRRKLSRIQPSSEAAALFKAAYGGK